MYCGPLQVPCAVCARVRSVRLDMWGTDACPARAGIGFQGYIMTSPSQRTKYTCVDKTLPVTARTTSGCTQRACPTDGSSLTHFGFERHDWMDFLRGRRGTVALATGCGTLAVIR